MPGVATPLSGKQTTVKLLNKVNIGYLSLVEGLSSSRSFCSKPIGSFVKTKNKT